jgi:hypothetical protein
MSKEQLLHITIEGRSPQKIRQAEKQMGCNIYQITRRRGKGYSGNGYIGHGTIKIVPNPA